MAVYLRDHHVLPVNGGTHAIAAAIDRSTCSHRSWFPQHVVDVGARTANPLGELGLAAGARSIAGATRAPRALLASRNGSARVVDLATLTTVADFAFSSNPLGVALDGSGAVAAAVLADRITFVDIATSRERGSIALSTERRFQGYVTWCEAGWVVARATGKKWSVALVEGERTVAKEIGVRGEPFTLRGAGGAPIVACGIGKTLACTVNLATGKAVAVALPPAPGASTAVSVAIADDGAFVLARQTGQATIYGVRRGDKAAAPVATVDTPTVRLDDRNDILTQPSFAICGATIVTRAGEDFAFLDA